MNIRPFIQSEKTRAFPHFPLYTSWSMHELVCSHTRLVPIPCSPFPHESCIEALEGTKEHILDRGHLLDALSNAFRQSLAGMLQKRWEGSKVGGRSDDDGRRWGN